MRTSKVSRKRCAAGAASGGPEVPRAFGRNPVCVNVFFVNAPAVHLLGPLVFRVVSRRFAPILGREFGPRGRPPPSYSQKSVCNVSFGACLFQRLVLHVLLLERFVAAFVVEHDWA